MQLWLLTAVMCVWATICWGASAPSASVLSEQEVREVVQRIVQQKVSGRGWETQLRKVVIPNGVKLPSGNRELELIPPRHWDGWGTASMALLVRVNGRIERNVTVRIEIDALADMVVAARQIPAGTILAAEDLMLQKQEVSQAQGRFVAALEDAIGKRARTTIRQNAALRSDQIDRVPVIKSGQLVTIVAESTTLRITASGRAKSSGSVGDVVMVQNLTSGKEFPAKVLDGSTVLIGY